MTSYVFQLVSFPPPHVRDVREGSTVDIEVEPPPDCVMLDWKLCDGLVFIRWRKTPAPGDVTPIHSEDLPR